MKIIRRYASASSRISGGVCSISSIGRVKITETTVSTRAMAKLSRIPAAKLFLTPFSSSAPKRWAVTMEKPEVSPDTNPRIRKEMLPVHPTAASALTPMVRPTIRVSAML